MMSASDVASGLLRPGLDELILSLLREASGEHLSGGSLRDRLSVSRSTITRHVRELRQQGYEIEAHPRLGYRLIGSPDLLFSHEILRGLRTDLMGRRVFSYRQIRSTNETAMNMARGGASEGSLVVAEEQTAGRGRLRRSWHSPPGVGLWASLVLRPRMPSTHVFQLAICGALAVAETVCAAVHLPVKVKWPNDVLVNGKKLAGILTETQLTGGKVLFVIVGMGINVNQDGQDFPRALRNKATSLKMELKRPVSRIPLLQDVLMHFEQIYHRFQAQGLAPFLDRWRELSWVLGRQVSLRVGGRIISGRAVDIAETGALVLEVDSGRRHCFLAGDASVLEEAT
jgi:BirA family biotin operon repressor/biotin-[acetyl-CoA-carboxylase] ligase